jgi:hypothetical protein
LKDFTGTGRSPDDRLSGCNPQRSFGLRENIVVRVATLLAVLVSFSTTALASDSKYVLNFDLITKLPDGSVGYSIQLQGIHLVPDKAFHGDDLGKYDYFLTVSGVENGKGKLTIEFYEYETRKKKSGVISEIVTDIDFSLGNPAVFEATSDTFGVDFAFSIVQKR